MFELLDRLTMAYFGWRMGRTAKRINASNNIQLKRAEISANGYDITMVAPNLLIMLDEACALLDAEQAENYMQFDMLPALTRTNGRPVRVTIQWRNGESPAEQNARLRAEIEQLRNRKAA